MFFIYYDEKAEILMYSSFDPWQMLAIGGLAKKGYYKDGKYVKVPGPYVGPCQIHR